jgi:NAD(P)-dependent dehydrogenase (short-subunit alcohol dehydrogenase family)
MQYCFEPTKLIGNNQIVAFVTGGSSDIGLESALMLARIGFITYAIMCTPEKDALIKHVIERENVSIVLAQLDVTDSDSVKNAINAVISEEGRIDAVVNNT